MAHLDPLHLLPFPHLLEKYPHAFLFQRPHSAEDNTAPGAEKPGFHFQV